MFVHPAFFGMPSGPELIIVAVIVLVLFGSRLPKVMRSLGSSLTEFKKGVNEGTGEEEPQPTETRIETKTN